MGIPDGAHTHRSGGGGQLVLALLAVLGAAAVAGPVLAAVAELVHVLLILAVVLLGLGAAGLAAVVAWRLRWRHVNETARVLRPDPPPWPPVQARSEPRALQAPQPRAIERPAVHLHFHGVSAEDVAAIIRHEVP